MKKLTAIGLALVFVLSTALLGCERKDVKEEMDNDKEKVMENEEGAAEPLSPDPEEADKEMPGVPDKMPDRPGAPED